MMTSTVSVEQERGLPRTLVSLQPQNLRKRFDRRLMACGLSRPVGVSLPPSASTLPR